MTVVTIVLIAIVLSAGIYIVNRMMTNTSEKSKCINDGGTWENGSCNMNI